MEIFAEPKSPEIRKQLLYIIETLEQDNCQSWLMQPDGTYRRVERQEGERSVNSQMALYDYFTHDAEDIPVAAVKQPHEKEKEQREEREIERTMQMLRAADEKKAEKEPPKQGFFHRLFGFLFH